MANAPEVRRSDVEVGEAELRVVERIEELRAEFQLLAFPHLDVLKNRQVPVVHPRHENRIAPHVSIASRAERKARPRAHPPEVGVGSGRGGDLTGSFCTS